jgi:demethylmenaquinone methyltransferase/2-methoxy-6-polyprenyl-1,4-benzoquinol methylase
MMPPADDHEPRKRVPKMTSRKYRPVSTLDGPSHVAVVRDIFATITGRYDFLNHLFSLRRDVAWRRAAADQARFGKTNRYLDIATGTGDLAVAVAGRHGGITVTGLDFVGEMLRRAGEKIRETSLNGRIAFLRADAMSLPFPGEAFDTVGIAFGIRNIPDRSGALREMHRVLVPGGTLLVLEMHFPSQPLFRHLYGFYLGRVLPRMARSFSRNPEAYCYLADSIMHFPSPGRFVRILEESGFSNVRCRPLTFGITCLYTGVKSP